MLHNKQHYRKALHSSFQPPTQQLEPPCTVTYSTIGKHLLSIFRFIVDTYNNFKCFAQNVLSQSLFSIQYLDALFVKDPQAGMDYHELQVLNGPLPCYEFRLECNLNYA